MALNGLSDFGGFYNNYKVVDIPRVDFDTVREQDARKTAETQAVPEPLKQEEPVVKTTGEDTRSRSADLDNISLTFNKGDDYSYLGSDFELGKLDMEQAISDMKKDKLLEDYQFFVGSSSGLNETFKSEDGTVSLKF